MNARNVEVMGIKYLANRMLTRISGMLAALFLVLECVVPVEAQATQNYMSVKQFIAAMEDAVGPLNIETTLKPNKKVTLGDAAILLVKAEKALGGEKVSKATADYILENRIAIKGKSSATRRRYLAKAYALGFIKGSSCGQYSGVRKFRINLKCSVTACKKMILRLKYTKHRYQMSPDYRLLRISKSGMPVLADMYEYILEDYPNGYYDSMFNFMIAQATPGNALQNELWVKRGCDVYLRKMTWDTAFSKLTFDDRITFLSDYDSSDRLGVYSAYVLPCEYDSFAGYVNKTTGRLSMPLNVTEKRAMADKAEEYAMYALNVDYRTIADDIQWQRYMIDNGIQKEEIEEYIKACIEDELIIECDSAAADISGIYYDKTPFTFKNSEGVVRTYAHYRVINDNGRAFEDGGLTICNGAARQCLRNTEISEDGLIYEWAPEDSWQEGFFDIGIDIDGKVNAAVFDVVRFKGVYVRAFGYPCETPCYYPGTLTVDGIISTRMKNMTKEKYLAEWGYLY